MEKGCGFRQGRPPAVEGSAPRNAAPRDAFPPEASPSDPTLRSGLPECGVRALSPGTGARGAQGRRGPCLLLPGTARRLTRCPSPQPRCQRAPGPPCPGLPSWERKQDGPVLPAEAGGPQVTQARVLWSVEVLSLC